MIFSCITDIDNGFGKPTINSLFSQTKPDLFINILFTIKLQEEEELFRHLAVLLLDLEDQGLEAREG